MKRLFALALLLLPFAAQAEGRVTLGYGRIFDNDVMGDGRDRWQTGSYTLSVLRGASFAGVLPETLGEILEWRLSSALVTPARIGNPAPGDRRYAGILSLGVHTQARWLGNDVDFGADLVAIGPATGLGAFQREVHDLLGVTLPDTSNQLPNQLQPTVSAEVGREMPAGPLRLRPFLSAQAGVEHVIRAGLDVTLGQFGNGAIMIRDTVTGQRYRGAVSKVARGYSLVAGGDMARVYGSALLPPGGPAPEEIRRRARIGLNWQGERASAFYGVTWLSEEFQGQPGGQTVGSLSVNLRF